MLLLLRSLPLLALLAAAAGGAAYVLGSNTSDVAAEGQVGLGNGASFFDLDPMQIAVDSDLESESFVTELEQRVPGAFEVVLRADRSLGTRSFITIEATHADDEQRATETLSGALDLLVERYNAAIVFDPSTLNDARESLVTETAAIDASIETLIAQEAVEVNSRSSDSASYERYELARNERFQLERERNALLDRVNTIDGQLLAPQLEASPSDQLRVLLPARLSTGSSSPLTLAFAVAAGVALVGALAVFQVRRDRLPLRLTSDLMLLTDAPVLAATEFDEAEVDRLVASLRGPADQTSVPRTIVTVAADGSVKFPDPGTGPAILIVTAGAQSVGETRVLLDRLRSLDVAVSTAVLTR